jgi:hypothetical protein
LSRASIWKGKQDESVDGEGERERERRVLEGLKRKKVCLVPGEACHMPERGWFRITFGVSEEVLKEALGRIEQLLTSGTEDAHAMDSGMEQPVEVVSVGVGIGVGPAAWRGEAGKERRMKKKKKKKRERRARKDTKRKIRVKA